jgi:predicted transcriptional regulator
MKGADDRILEFLAEEGPSSPMKMFNDGRIRFSRTYINVRCQELAERGLVVNLGNGVYQITDLGEKYLTGEFDTAELDEDTEREATAD